jgi:hypothetical protein
VRIAAIESVASLGGKSELPLLIQSLITIPATGDSSWERAEQAVVSLCLQADKVDQAAAVVLAAFPDATPEARCSLIRVLGQLNCVQALSALTAATGDEDPTVCAAAFEALGTSPDPRATHTLLSMVTEPASSKLKSLAFTACLRRVVTDRVPAERKTATLETLLTQENRGKNAVAVLAELPWLPSLDSLRLAQSHLDTRGLTEPAASAAVAIAQKLDMNDPKQRTVAIDVLKEVVKITNNDDTRILALAWIAQHGG